MATTAASKSSRRPRAKSRPANQGLLTRILNRCIELLPYLALPGYYPASHAYHFRAGSGEKKMQPRLPSAPFHR